MANLFYMIVIVKSGRKSGVRILKHGWTYISDVLNTTCLFARNLQVYLGARGLTAQNVTAFCASRFISDIGYSLIAHPSRRTTIWNTTEVNNWCFCSCNGYGFVFVDLDSEDAESDVRYSIGDSHGFGIRSFLETYDQDLGTDLKSWLRCKPSNKELLTSDMLKRLLPVFWDQDFYEKYLKSDTCL